jgi:hypothetical protein
MPKDPLLAAFARYLNLAYSVAIAADLRTSSLDDDAMLPGYRRDLATACRRAYKEVFAGTPTPSLIVFHTLVVESELVEVFGAAPGSAQECYLSARAFLFEIADNYRKHGLPHSGSN